MFAEFTSAQYICQSEAGKIAAGILSEEISGKTHISSEYDYSFIFNINEQEHNPDAFSVKCSRGETVFSAGSVRGLIYGAGLFLRKSVRFKNKISLLYDISGYYTPSKKIRGHQLGFRSCSNTYDAWGEDEYRKYSIELMFAGANTVEYIPYEKGYSARNEIMRYDEQELLCRTAETAHSLGLEVSLWYPNAEEDEEEALKNREKLFSQCPFLDSVFIPGADPGSLYPDELFSRCIKIKHILNKYHKDAKLYVSAQMPHNSRNWGNDFIKELRKLPEEIDGVIAGPNRAFDIDELRKKVPEKYPIRFYPDITHNLRCEYPVHFDKDDWNYALAAANGRESINPRPREFTELHKLTSPYIVGSVSYSEGVNDDINKFLWTSLDYNSDISTEEILEDYSRLFFPGCDYKKCAEAIKGLELNWEGSPEDNPQIEKTLSMWEDIENSCPGLYKNWRYVSCLFRACTDAFIRRKLIFENSLIKTAVPHIEQNNIEEAYNILTREFSQDIINLRKKLDINGERLYKLIGMQLSVSRFHASSAERGAVLDTVDLPVTDREVLINRIKNGRDIISYIKRTDIEKDEFFYSPALHGLSPGGVFQTPDFYIDFQGDRENINDGNLPVSLFKVYDHYSFRCRAYNLKDNTDYFLQITYKNPPYTESEEYNIKVNGFTVYKGRQFGGTVNTDYMNDFLPGSFTASVYKIPAEYIINGCADIEISEPHSGIKIAEVYITKKAYKSRTEN